MSSGNSWKGIRQTGVGLGRLARLALSEIKQDKVAMSHCPVAGCGLY
jgi:hypothetical protein